MEELTEILGRVKLTEVLELADFKALKMYVKERPWVHVTLESLDIPLQAKFQVKGRLQVDQNIFKFHLNTAGCQLQEGHHSVILTSEEFKYLPPLTLVPIICFMPSNGRVMCMVQSVWLFEVLRELTFAHRRAWEKVNIDTSSLKMD